ncbi:hypothetical protein [Ornithinimicrobium cryptoxanthini]|uniref:hypothetical protein n=1 Tax=Ornithinimicrobium cryptoxanthini TaxID=2934161 RepID=UPI0021180054|nr:hypothetical protein [Ornithinimicrobium cryptoxanthini]
MAEPSGSGPVEQEARQLVEAAARWLAAVPDTGAYADRADEQESDTEGSAGTGTGPGFGEDVDGSAGAEHLCRGCPWCRAKAAGPIGADTLDSIAHLLSAAAESLSLFAQSRREAQRRSEARPDSGPQTEAPPQGEDSEEHRDLPGDSRHDQQSDDSEGAPRWA